MSVLAGSFVASRYYFSFPALLPDCLPNAARWASDHHELWRCGCQHYLGPASGT